MIKSSPQAAAKTIRWDLFGTAIQVSTLNSYHFPLHGFLWDQNQKNKLAVWYNTSIVLQLTTVSIEIMLVFLYNEKVMD